MAEISDVFFVDGMRTPFGRAGEKGMYWRTRADDLVVKAAYVDEGPTLKRIRPRAKGSASRILKRTSHITVIVAPRKEA